MTDSDSGSRQTEASGQSSAQTAPGLIPSSRSGWWAVALSAVAIVAFAAVLVMAGLANDPGAINRGVMFGSVGLLLVAAAFTMFVVVVRRQHSALVILAAVITMSTVALALMLALGGFFNG